ncbi:MAG: GreA/GreB family elongation factor [Patescibacteria group bacterium]|nr:GreA/GreB family elongation factor [Patescibacteria group bacterium]
MRVPIRRGEMNNFKAKDYSFSQTKYKELELTLARLLQRRPKEAKEVKRLAEMGDFSENVGYQMAKGRLRGLNQRILDIEDSLKKADIVIVNNNTSQVQIGHKVTITSDGIKKMYTILGASESNPAAGVISASSPLGSALLNKKIGDEFDLEINGKSKHYFLINIEVK